MVFSLVDLESFNVRLCKNTPKNDSIFKLRIFVIIIMERYICEDTYPKHAKIIFLMINTSFIFYVEILIVLFISVFIIGNIRSLQRFDSYFIFSVIILPVLFFFYNLVISTEDIPFKDDYNLLDSLYEMKIASSFSEWLRAFLKQVNQHRFGFERMIMWLIYQVFGSENIKAQILIGNTFLLGIFYFFIKIFRELKLSWLYFIPISLLLFNYTYFENATWGIAAIQNTPIIFFALLSVYLLCLQTQKAFYVAILVAIITMFTSGNGLGIWIVGILFLTAQLRWKHLAIWFMVAFGVVLFYFQYDYEFIPSDKTNLWKHPFLNIWFVLAFWGNVFFANIPHPFKIYNYPDIVLCIVAGIFLTFSMLGLVWKLWTSRFQKYNQNAWFLLAVMCFLALTGLMLVTSRPAEIKIYNGGELLSRRYMIFGAMFLCLGYLSYLCYFQNHKKLLKLGIVVFIPLSLGLNIYNYYTSIPDVYRQQQELKLDGYYWKNYKMLLTFGEKYEEKMFFNHPTYMENLVNHLDSASIYKLTQNEIVPLINLIKKGNRNTNEVFKGTLDTSMSKALTIAKESKDKVLFKVKSNGKNVVYFGLKSAKNVFIFPAIPVPNTFKKALLSQYYYNFDFSYEIWKEKFPADNYEVWLIEKDELGNFKAIISKKNIRIN